MLKKASSNGKWQMADVKVATVPAAISHSIDI